MSLVPMLFSDWWEDIDRPHSVLDQHIGLYPDELVHRPGITTRHAEQLGYPFFRRMRRRHHPFHHALARRTNGKGSSLFCQTEKDKDKFFVTLDVQQFAPDEIVVKVVDRTVVVEAKHEEKEDDHGWIARQFTRRYAVPVQYDVENIESTLSSDGVLTVIAPRRKPINAANNEKFIKIQYTGEPAFFHNRDALQSKTGEAQEGVSTSDYQQQRVQMAQRGKKVNVKGPLV